MEDRTALRGIVYVLCKKVSRRDVPTERIGGSGVTAWRRLRDRTETGVRPRLRQVLLGELPKARRLDTDDAAVDGTHVRTHKGGLHRTFAPWTEHGRAADTT